MKTNQHYSTLSLLILTLLLLFASSCDKDDNDQPSPEELKNEETSALFNPNVTYDTMTDQDGNVYKTVTIGTQTWMAENLRTTKYNDGASITNITDNDEWGALTNGAYCNFNNTTSIDTIVTYGRLYNWFSVNTNKLAPLGWHVPTDEEWRTLIEYLGRNGAEHKLKETGTSHWSSPNDFSTNESGFTALPGGWRSYDNSFESFGKQGYWWTATEYDARDAWSRSMNYYSDAVVPGGYVGRGWLLKKLGHSIRCVKD